MPKFSEKSLAFLNTCDPKLQDIFLEIIEYFDISILCGERNEKEQTDAYNSRASQLKYPYSKHNKKPSLAVDVAPYPIDWHDPKRFFASYTDEQVIGLVGEIFDLMYFRRIELERPGPVHFQSMILRGKGE